MESEDHLRAFRTAAAPPPSGEPESAPWLTGWVGTARAWIWRQRLPLVVAGGIFLAASAPFLPKRVSATAGLLGAALLLGSAPGQGEGSGGAAAGP